MPWLIAAHSCVMKEHKNDLTVMSVRQLLARRRALAGRVGDVEQMLAGSLVEQARRCGKAGCRCADGEPHGPYAYFAPRTSGRGRLKYVPSGLVEAVERIVEPAGAPPDLRDQRRAPIPARAGIAGDRRSRRPVVRPCAGRSGGGAGQHDDGGAGRRS